MTQAVLNGVSKKVRLDFQNGILSETMITKQYERNRKEAMEFSTFGYGLYDLMEAHRNTHNPLLKSRLQQVIDEFKEKRLKSGSQNKLSIEKLQMFKDSALGIGLRKVISKMKRYCRNSHNEEAELLLMLLKLEFANLSAKVSGYSKSEREYIYERKEILLHKIQPLLQRNNWRYGYNASTGKNASYVIYVYLPNGAQVSWHTNDYNLYTYYPVLEVEWDGQVCMTMEKILNYINDTYLKLN